MPAGATTRSIGRSSIHISGRSVVTPNGQCWVALRQPRSLGWPIPADKPHAGRCDTRGQSRRLPFVVPAHHPAAGGRFGHIFRLPHEHPPNLPRLPRLAADGGRFPYLGRRRRQRSGANAGPIFTSANRVTLDGVAAGPSRLGPSPAAGGLGSGPRNRVGSPEPQPHGPGPADGQQRQLQSWSAGPQPQRGRRPAWFRTTSSAHCPPGSQQRRAGLTPRPRGQAPPAAPKKSPPRIRRAHSSTRRNATPKTAAWFRG